MGRGKLISSHPFPPVTFSPAVFPRKLRVSALVVFCPPRRRMGDGTAPHRRDNFIIGSALFSSLVELRTSPRHHRYGQLSLSLLSLSLVFIGGSLFSSAHRSWRLLIDVATFSCLSLSCTSRNVSRPKFWRANAVANMSPTPPLAARCLKWRGPQEGGSLAFSSLVGDVHEVSNRFA